MNEPDPATRISYISWILGQTSSILGIILVVIYGFDLVLLQASRIYAQNLGEIGQAAAGWVPPMSPALIGLGIALVGWLAAYLRSLICPVAVPVGAVLNFIALILALIALTY
ncbi:hypothetical protein [Tautonia marina]|uniref:hypothetical protein n=1 Tax=Tautonia marina TaxID=2653855 RepID=UPI0012611CA7|nr:hypothetical protein [Tautonia marina]